MMDPVGALIGSILLGMGVLLILGSVRNKKVFGPDGMLTSALTTGSLVPLDKVPAAYETSTVAKEAIAGTGAIWVLPRAVRSAIETIAITDDSLAASITEQLNVIDSDSTHEQVMPLAQLLTIGDQRGHKIENDAIRLYIKGLTGESI